MSLKIGSLSEYTEKIEKFLSSSNALNSTTHFWFRGQSKKLWNLAPTLYRGWINIEREREILRDFKLKAGNFLEKEPTSDLEWLFVMQHYGMPTRLLDWTESHLLALYFAVNEYSNNSDACVWVLDPWPNFLRSIPKNGCNEGFS